MLQSCCCRRLAVESQGCCRVAGLLQSCCRVARARRCRADQYRFIARHVYAETHTLPLSELCHSFAPSSSTAQTSSFRARTLRAEKLVKQRANTVTHVRLARYVCSRCTKRTTHIPRLAHTRIPFLPFTSRGKMRLSRKSCLLPYLTLPYLATFAKPNALSNIAQGDAHSHTGFGQITYCICVPIKVKMICSQCTIIIWPSKTGLHERRGDEGESGGELRRESSQLR